MPKVRPLEVRALVPLLEEDWDSPEELAESLIMALDQARTERTSYVAVMQFGEGSPFYVGLGPYPGTKSAIAALKKHPAASMAVKRVIVPMIGPEGFEQLLRKVG